MTSVAILQAAREALGECEGCNTGYGMVCRPCFLLHPVALAMQQQVDAAVAEEREAIAARADSRRPCCDGRAHSVWDFHEFADWIRARSHEEPKWIGDEPEPKVDAPPTVTRKVREEHADD